MNVIAIILSLLRFAPDAIKLILAVTHEVHQAQVNMPGAPGADKSQRVIDKVTPIASAIEAAAPHVQEMIDTVVDISKAAGIGAWANDDQAAGG